MAMPSDQTNNEIAQGRAISRAEWIAAASFGMSLLLVAYVAGIESQRLADHDRRLTSVEAAQAADSGKIEQLLVTTSRIDANVSAIADQVKESRSHGK